MERDNTLISVFMLVVALLFVTLSIYIVLTRPVDVIEYPTSFEVVAEDRIGFDNNVTALTFGKISRPGASTRTISITNSQSFDVLIKVEATSEISDYISVEPEYFVRSGESQNISINAVIEEDTPVGMYSGVVRFASFRV